jgi:hypothetical protein
MSVEPVVLAEKRGWFTELQVVKEASRKSTSPPILHGNETRRERRRRDKRTRANVRTLITLGHHLAGMDTNTNIVER